MIVVNVIMLEKVNSFVKLLPHEYENIVKPFE